jgi:DNA primase
LLRKAFGPGDSSRDGYDYVIVCPSCKKGGKSKKKLSVRLEDGVFHCWVCGLKGQNIEHLFRKYAPSHLDEARSIRFTKGENTHLTETNVTDDHQEARIPDGFILLASNTASHDPDVKDAVRYCYDRGLSHKDLWYFKLGTCTSGSFRRRVIFPSFDAEGTLNYFTARAIDPIKTMKYINAKVPKKEVIFNEINIDWSRELNLVEGPFDLTKAAGNSTCLLGSHLSKDSALGGSIIRHRTPVLLALDPDAREKSHNIAKMLYSYGIRVRSVDVPAGRDVGDMTKNEFTRLVETATVWEQRDRLLHMISNIKSGSIL